MGNNTINDTLNAGKKLLLTAAVIVFFLWFAYEIAGILLLLFLTIVLTLILNAPVMWLVSKRVPRTVAALLVFLLMLVFIFGIGWLVVPKILEQVTTLVNNLPEYYNDLNQWLATLLKDYPELQKKLMGSGLREDMPSAMNVISHVSQLSFSVVGAIFLLVMFFSIVAYMLIDPVPLVETYLNLFPNEKRHKAAHALARASNMMVGWMKSNLVVGVIEAVLVFFFLTYMDVPGVWIWVGLAVFAEMIPKLGLYIMMIPPVLIALSVSPLTALWVLIFYLLLNELMGDLVVPKIRASAMNLHPISSLFVMLAMVAAFGLPGALVATPLTAFIKAYYEEFFRSDTTEMEMKDNIDIILERKI